MKSIKVLIWVVIFYCVAALITSCMQSPAESYERPGSGMQQEESDQSTSSRAESHPPASSEEESSISENSPPLLKPKAFLKSRVSIPTPVWKTGIWISRRRENLPGSHSLQRIPLTGSSSDIHCAR